MAVIVTRSASIEIFERGSIRSAFSPKSTRGVPALRRRESRPWSACRRSARPRRSAATSSASAHLALDRGHKADQRDAVVVAQHLDREARRLDGAGGDHVHPVADAARIDQRRRPCSSRETAAPRSGRCRPGGPEGPSVSTCAQLRPSRVSRLVHGSSRCAVSIAARRPRRPPAPKAPAARTKAAGGDQVLGKTHGAEGLSGWKGCYPRRKPAAGSIRAMPRRQETAQGSAPHPGWTGTGAGSTPGRRCRAGQLPGEVPAEAPRPRQAPRPVPADRLRRQQRHQHGRRHQQDRRPRETRAASGRVLSPNSRAVDFTPISASSSRS